MAVTRSDRAAPASPSSSAAAPVAAAPAGRSPSPEMIGLVAVTVIGLVARCWARSPLWLDEALSVNIARLPIGDIPEALRHDGHPPLYYFILHFWMRAFGAGDVAVRALSGVLGVAAVVALWFATSRAAGRRAAWAAMLIAAISPFAVRYATEARMYTLVMLLVAVGYLLVRRALDVPRPARLALVALASGLLLLTHYWALWLVGAAVIGLGWRAWRPAERAGRPAAGRVAVAVAAGGVLLAPWLPSLAYQTANTGTPWAGPVRPTVIVQVGLVDFGSAVTGRAMAEAGLVALVLGMLFLVGLFGRGIDQHRLELDVRTVPDVRSEAVVVGLTIVLGAAAGLATGTTFAGRYLAVVFPLFVIVCGAGLAKVPGRSARFVVALGLVGLCLVGVGVNAFGLRTQAGEVADELAGEARPGDVVVFCPDQLGPAVSRELPDGLVELVYPSLAGPERVDWVDYQDRYAQASPDAIGAEVIERAGRDRPVWVVTGSLYNVSDQCAEFTAALGAQLGPGAVLVSERPDIFEPAGLTRFGPAG